MSVEQEIVSKKFLERLGSHMYKTVIKRWVFDDPDEIEIRLPFSRSFSTFSNISGGLCTQVLT